MYSDCRRSSLSVSGDRLLLLPVCPNLTSLRTQRVQARVSILFKIHDTNTMGGGGWGGGGRPAPNPLTTVHKGEGVYRVGYTSAAVSRALGDSKQGNRAAQKHGMPMSSSSSSEPRDTSL